MERLYTKPEKVTQLHYFDKVRREDEDAPA
jgi:hypothetical protein